MRVTLTRQAAAGVCLCIDIYGMKCYWPIRDIVRVSESLADEDVELFTDLEEEELSESEKAEEAGRRG